MNKKTLNILFEKASNDKAPVVEITNSVISIISSNELKPQWLWDKPLMWIAAFSSAVAVPVVILAVVLHNAWIGPLFELSQAVSWAI